jgi:hypothetical protein
MTLNFVGFLGSDAYSIHSDDDTYLDGSIKTIEKDFEPRSDLIKLKIEDPSRKVDIEGYNGDIVKIKVNKCCNMDLMTDTGSITVKIPKDSDVKIDAESDVGNIYCDLPLEMKRETREIVGYSALCFCFFQIFLLV